MSNSKILSVSTGVGLTLVGLLIFGWTWVVFSVSLCVSVILGILYYILLKKVLGEDNYDGKTKM